MNNNVTWPPSYIVRRHPLARHVKLHASRVDGLVISTPKRFNLKHIPQILEENRNWIIARLKELQTNMLHELPTIIELPALGLKIDNIYQNHEELIRSLRKLAKDFLNKELIKVSQACQLPFSKLSVRNQKTMWGSCTAKNAISLNYKLIFLPYSLARHVMIHELCHTQHHNHSTKFWQLVASYDSNWREHRRQLRRAENLIPRWL